MKKKFLVLTALIFTIALYGCGDKPPPPKEHVWKDLTDTIDKAKGLENTLQDEAKREGEEVDKMSR
jgi:predicted small lipoprotein YifL